MRFAAFLLLGLLLILAQSIFYHLVNFAAAVASLVGSAWGHGEAPHWLVHGVTPNLVLPLIIFLGVHEASMIRGALLAFLIGYLLDALGSAPIGLFTFVSVALWWLSRVLGLRLTAQTVLPRIVLALGFSFLESAMVLVLLTIFGADTRRPVELSTIVIPRAVTTAIFAPLIFRLAQRLHANPGAPSQPAPERGAA